MNIVRFRGSSWKRDEECSVRRGVTPSSGNSRECRKVQWQGGGAAVLPVGWRGPGEVSTQGVPEGVWLLSEVNRQEACRWRDWRLWWRQNWLRRRETGLIHVETQNSIYAKTLESRLEGKLPRCGVGNNLPADPASAAPLKHTETQQALKINPKTVVVV